jgi:hypothetical protein
MGPYAGVDYNLTLCPLQSRLQHIYHGQSYARVDLNPLPESTLAPQSGTFDLASVQPNLLRLLLRGPSIILIAYKFSEESHCGVLDRESNREPTYSRRFLKTSKTA